MVSIPVKYRPQTFDEVTEQSSIITILKNQIQNNCINNALMFCGESGSGKAQPLTSKIFTPSGYKLMGDIKVGDLILDGKGNSTKVLKVFPQGKRDIYRIFINDGTYIEVADNHLNRVYYYKDGIKVDKDLTTLELIDLINNSNIPIHIPTTDIKCWKSSHLSVDPYLLGCLIGDGSLHNNFSFSNKDKDILEKVDSKLRVWGMGLKEIPLSDCDYNISLLEFKNYYIINYKGIDYDGIDSFISKLIEDGYPKFDEDTILRWFSNPEKSSTLKKYKEIKKLVSLKINPFKVKSNHKTIPKLLQTIKDLNLRVVANQKRIPQQYLFSSYEDRLELLRGLMDTDGTFEKNGGSYFSTCSPYLAEEVAFLARSLGMRAKIKKSNIKYRYIYKDKDEIRAGQDCYSIFIRGDLNPFYCSRKSQKFIDYTNNRSRKPYPLRTISNIEFNRVDECQCIYVESEDHTYITDNLTVTHNTTCARIFAKELGAQTIEIDAASNNGVDNIRSITVEASERSLSNEYKCYIIDEFHMMTISAFNAILKTLEEPPAHTIFIFCTTDPQKIPQTILNRVQRFNFRKISSKGIYDRLLYVCQQEGFKFEENALDYLSKIANGSMREALSLLGQIADYSKGSIDMESVRSTLGSYSYENFFGLTNAILDGNEKLVINYYKDYEDTGSDLKLFVNQYFSFILDIIKYSLFKDTSVINIPNIYIKDLDNLINFDSPEKYYNYIIDRLMNLRQMIKNDSYINSTILAVLLQITRCQ